MKCYEDLMARGIVDNTSNEEVIEKLNNDSVSFYAGYDPTAKSLQLGNLAIVITQMRLQKYGHKPYVLVGGATGMIGDPSGKSDERNLLDTDALQTNIDAQKAQLESYLDFNSGENSAVLVNNYDWTSELTFLDFMRTIGKRFRVSEMLAKDSVKSRITSDAGISFTEFSYQILQANDFAHLAKEHNVTLQIGGSDQWGNMTAGIDLARKQYQKQVYVMTMPLLTDSNGKKFGKSVGGETIYLDTEMTSPYKMYQFLLNTDDSCVDTYLKYLTFLSLDEIAELEVKTKEEPHLRAGQKALAKEIVTLVHGTQGLEAAERATSFFFGGVIEKVTDKEIASIFEDIPSVSLSSSYLEEGDVLDLLAETPLFKSKGEARRSVQQNGVSLNNVKITDPELKITKTHLASESAMVLRKGKKNYCVVKFS
jgi:tyrosyl-tRNA synthetase